MEIFQGEISVIYANFPDKDMQIGQRRDVTRELLHAIHTKNNSGENNAFSQKESEAHTYSYFFALEKKF